MNEFLKTREEIEAWLIGHSIKGYKLVECRMYGYRVNVEQSVHLRHRSLSFIPVKFGEISLGYFDCSSNCLTSLEFAPSYVCGTFNISQNYITSLKGAPSYIGEEFKCYENSLTSLNFFPREVKGSIWVDDNKLVNLEGAPSLIKGGFSCMGNKLTSLKGAPEKVGSNFYCAHNKLTSLEGIPKHIGNILAFSSNDIQDLKHLPDFVGGKISCYNNPRLGSMGVEMLDQDAGDEHWHTFADLQEMHRAALEKEKLSSTIKVKNTKADTAFKV